MLCENNYIPDVERRGLREFIEEELKNVKPFSPETMAERYLRVVKFHSEMVLPEPEFTQQNSMHLFDMSLEIEEGNLLQTQFEKTYSQSVRE
jgi:hypothetical protein